MWRRTLDSWEYSPLDQIDRSNVTRLEQVWSRGLSAEIQEGTPLVRDGVMFMPNPLDVVQALDAATGKELWEYRRQLPADIGKFVPFPAINRNLAIYGMSIIDTSADDSPANKWNPDPTAAVRWGDQSGQEMLSAPMGIIVDRNVDPKTVVERGAFPRGAEVQ